MNKNINNIIINILYHSGILIILAFLKLIIVPLNYLFSKKIVTHYVYIVSIIWIFLFIQFLAKLSNITWPTEPT